MSICVSAAAQCTRPNKLFLFHCKMMVNGASSNHRSSASAGKVTNGSSAASNIPLRNKAPSVGRTLSSSSTNSSSSSMASPVSKIPVSSGELAKWKHKYEEADLKRRDILIENEKTGRLLNDLQKRHLDLQMKIESMETELFEKNEEFAKLQTVSKNLYTEYERMKNLYETETGAMSRALQDASMWYRQNKELKRRTLLLDVGDTVDEGVDAGEGESDIENLNKTIKQLSQEVAELQTELDAVKHTEFQINEQNIKLSEELEDEKQANVILKKKVSELEKGNAQILRVSEMLTKELKELKKNDEQQKSHVVELKREADSYKKERNVLAHQSTILLQGLNVDENPDSLMLLQEIEKLQRNLEEERTKYDEEIAGLLEKIDELENDQRIEILEERLKLAEGELQESVNRAESLEAELRAKNAPPAPPPPPPPPGVVMTDNPPVVPLRVKRRSRVNVLEIADAIGIQEENKKAPPQGVNEDIINAIKEGKFVLKKPKNGGGTEEKKEKDSPKAVSEFLNILGSLRRAPKKRQSQFFTEV